MATPPIIRFEICAPRKRTATDLSEIVQVRARSIGTKFRTKTRIGRSGPRKSTITLHVPAELAATQNRVWCVACDLACFCPYSRVSVLVQGETPAKGAALTA